MKELFKRLDLVGYISEYENHLAREKPLFLEGDSKLHFEIIASLQNYNFKNPPQIANLDTPLAHLTKQGILNLKEIYEFVKIVRYFAYLLKQPFEGRVAGWLEGIVIPKQVWQIVEYFDDEGEIKPSVDVRLGELKESLAQTKSQLLTQFRQLLSTKRLEPYLVDHQVHLYYSQEALLVRGGFNHVLKGSVIGRSSGGFFYVVPESVENLKKKEASLLDRYEEIIYEYCKKISAEFGKKQPFLKFINSAFDRFDNYCARISFAKSRNLEFLLPSKKDEVVLSGFSHPAISNAKSIHVEFRGSVLMVTGVNAGGKTMLLKSILSAVLMAKYLLPLPLDASKSSIGLFKNIEAIIEDPQNVKNDISTFAGRMVSFGKLFSKKTPMIVGVDEIELGTDSDEAASLFKVIIEELMDRGVKLIVTTHHKRLASLLATDERVELLAALYDEKNQKPTYEFLKGTIGKSYAFETALRYGISQSLIAKAKVVYGEDKEKLNELIQKNIDLELSMKQKVRELDEEYLKAQKSTQRVHSMQEELEQKYIKRESELESEYQNAIKIAKDAVKSNDSTQIHRALNQAQNAKKLIQKQEIVQTKEPLKVGDSIKYGKLKGSIKALKGEKAIIECDGIRLHVPLSSIKKSGYAQTPAKEVRAKIELQRSGRGGINLDLHGLRAEDAIEKVDQFLSDALINGFDEVVIYHGIGTGKLAFGVRNFLKSHPRDRKSVV